jgi:hypothetical protein
MVTGKDLLAHSPRMDALSNSRTRCSRLAMYAAQPRDLRSRLDQGGIHRIGLCFHLSDLTLRRVDVPLGKFADLPQRQEQPLPFVGRSGCERPWDNRLKM